MSRARSFCRVVILSLLLAGLVAAPSQARGFRVSLLPNGGENGCANCHVSPGGGGSRNLFGEDVNGLVTPGGRQLFWTAAFAAEDSDDDGFTNGEELGDIDGDGTLERTVNISLPGVADNVPLTAIGDCNLDTVLDASDLSCVSDIDARDAVLSALNTLPGDLDGNGDIAFTDFLVLSGNFGKSDLGYSDGNIDLEGAVNFADFLILSSTFGQTIEGANLSAVPEPHGSYRTLVALLPTLCMRKSRRSAMSGRGLRTATRY